MRAIGNKIGVVFDETHLKTYDLGNGIQLERAQAWRAKEGDEESITKVETNVNHLETNPQIGYIAMTNDAYEFEMGDKVFMHYLAYEEFEEKIDIDGKECYLIEESFIFFVIKNGIYEMRPNTYLGRVVIEEPPKTTTGIYLTSQEAVKNDLRISITHVPVEKENEHGILVKNVCEIGEEVIPMDKFNYPVKLDGEEYVMLKDTEIVGRYATEAEA